MSRRIATADARGPGTGEPPVSRCPRACSRERRRRARASASCRVCKTQGLPGLIGRCSNRTNEEESPMRLTTILRKLLGFAQLYVEQVQFWGRVGCACRYARRGAGPVAGRAAAARRATTGDRSGCGGMCRGDRRRCGCGMRRGGCRAVTAGCGSNRCRGRRAAARSRRRARSWWRIWRRRWTARRSVV